MWGEFPACFVLTNTLISCFATKVRIYWLNAIIYYQNFIFQSGTRTTLPIPQKPRDYCLLCKGLRHCPIKMKPYVLWTNRPEICVMIVSWHKSWYYCALRPLHCYIISEFGNICKYIYVEAKHVVCSDPKTENIKRYFSCLLGLGWPDRSKLADCLLWADLKNTDKAQLLQYSIAQ
jgi:hypothetical protein